MIWGTFPNPSCLISEKRLFLTGIYNSSRLLDKKLFNELHESRLVIELFRLLGSLITSTRYARERTRVELLLLEGESTRALVTRMGFAARTNAVMYCNACRSAGRINNSKLKPSQRLVWDEGGRGSVEILS